MPTELCGNRVRCFPKQVVIQACNLGTVLLLTLPSLGVCQTLSVQDGTVQSSVTREQSVADNDIPLSELLEAVHTAEDNFFSLFNEFNDDARLDFHCYQEAPLGRRLKQRVCRANFVQELTGEMSREYRPVDDLTLRSMERLLQEQMNRLVAEHRELFDALGEVSHAKERYDSEFSRRCGGRKRDCR
jgi:hypothetical protein